MFISDESVRSVQLTVKAEFSKSLSENPSFFVFSQSWLGQGR